MKFINYAIDLGTTNSLIAKSDNGIIQVFKNPKGFKEALPSVVAYRKNGILVGDKARELKDRDPKNVFSSFKRKMGTDQVFNVDITNETVSPIQLSTLVLNELKTFLVDEATKSVVITIPASFDTIQSIATKDAGIAAGFDEVVLLQEPIAACLAVFNQHNDITEGKWLIYDLGGGTFDVAIVHVTEGELKVLDHQGNNFLGGLDFDISIVNEHILPQLKLHDNFDGVVAKLQANNDDKETQAIFNYLLYYAEQLKIELTSYKESYVEFQLKDDDGEFQDVEIKLTREQFNKSIEPGINQTLRLVNDLLSDNHLQASDFEEMVLVGGSTYTPFVREKIEQEIGMKVNQKIDPTNAIVVGAAHYAANKPSRAIEEKPTPLVSTNYPAITAVFETQSRKTEEIVLLKTKNFSVGYLYRITRGDNGYDSGKVHLQESMTITVPLVNKSHNTFSIELYNEQGQLLDQQQNVISISQGLFVIDGQPLPHDICIEVDDINFHETKLQPIFLKNNILPLKKTIYKTVSRNMLSESDDELLINILEGESNASPATNNVIGCISIRPKQIGKNLIKDTEIEITLSVSENRELEISACIPSLDYEILNVFNPNSKSVSPNKLQEELRFLIHQATSEKEKALNQEEFERVQLFHQIIEEAEEAISKIRAQGNTINDTTYHVDEWKRQLAVKYDSQTRSNRIKEVLKSYQDTKNYMVITSESPDFSDRLKMKLTAIYRDGDEAVANSNLMMLKDLIRQMDEISWEYRKTNVNELKGMYISYKLVFPDGYKDPKAAEQIINTADQHLMKSNASYTEFYSVFGKLHSLLKDELKNDDSNSGFDMKGTGLQ